jgi:hypothetical protein
MSVWCSGRGGFTRGRGHGFEPRQPRSVAILREKMRDLRLYGDGWVAGWWGLSYKKSFFLFIFAFYVPTRKTSVLAGDLSAPSALGLYVGGWTTARSETICAGTRSLAGAPPASKDPFYPPAQIVCGLVYRTSS